MWKIRGFGKITTGDCPHLRIQESYWFQGEFAKRITTERVKKQTDEKNFEMLHSQTEGLNLTSTEAIEAATLVSTYTVQERYNTASKNS